MKEIKIKLELEGSGIVNYEGTQSSLRYNKKTNRSGMYDNYNYAKVNLYKNDDGSLEQLVKISSGCLTHNIFEKEQHLHTNDIITDDTLLTVFMANPMSIARGYLFARKKGTPSFKRKASLTLTDAEQTNGAVIMSEVHSRSGDKEKRENKEGKEVSNSLFHKDNVGHIEYLSEGVINLQELQFVSMDQKYDRYAMDPDRHEQFTALMSNHLTSFDSQIGNYKKKCNAYDVSERGFLFKDSEVSSMAKLMLSRLLTVNITRKDAYARTKSLKVKLISDPMDSLNNDNWIDIKTLEDIDKLDIKVEPDYILE